MPPRDVEQAVRMILERMAKALVSKQRIEIRGFGSFSLHYRAPRTGRNPKTGDSVTLSGKYVPHLSRVNIYVIESTTVFNYRLSNKSFAKKPVVGWRLIISP